MTTAAVAHNLEDKPRTGDVLIKENVTFDGLLLSDSILKGLKSSGFERPSPIQLKAIPLGRCGLDLIVQAKSGTGKTCVFSVVALEALQLDSSALQVLILAPTREIAIQIWDVIKSLGQGLPQMKCHTFIGGMPIQEDKQKLKRCHIAVGTPGRIKQLIEQQIMNIENIRMFILDEADKLLEESFQGQINWIYSTLPDNKQMLALSATYPEYLAEHLTAYMRNPTFLRLNVSDPALLGIRQYYRTVKYHPLPNKLFERKVEVVTEILTSVEFQQCLIFSNLQTMAQNMADVLSVKGWPTACIAGCLDQKDRNQAMEKLKSFKCRVLISTDLTSRGIDADKINLVINLDVPKDHETYLHRTGRAGRFGTFGACISIVSDGQELTNLHAIEKKCSTSISLLTDPIPVDLVKSACTVNLDDMVSTEKILTNNQLQNNSVSRVLISPVKAEKSSQGVNSDAHDTELNYDATVKISPGEKLASFTKVDHGNVVNAQCSPVTVKTGIRTNLNRGYHENETNTNINGELVGKNEYCYSPNTLNKELEENQVTNDRKEKTEKHTQIKTKPKSKFHKSANFWTQLIEERNDDEDFVREFHANQAAKDFRESEYSQQGNQDVSDSKLNISDLELKMDSVEIEEETEYLKRKTPNKGQKLCQESLRCNGNIQDQSLHTYFNDTKKETSHEALVQEMKMMEIRIPSLQETMGYSPLKAPHTYQTALRNFLKFKESGKDKTYPFENKIDTENADDSTQLMSLGTEKKMEADTHNLGRNKFPVQLAKSTEWEKELLVKVKKYLNLKSLLNKASENLVVKGNSCGGKDFNRHESRKQLKAVRNRKTPNKDESEYITPVPSQESVVSVPSSPVSGEELCNHTSEEYVRSQQNSITSSSGSPANLSLFKNKNDGNKVTSISKGGSQKPKGHRLGLSVGAFLQDLQSKNNQKNDELCTLTASETDKLPKNDNLDCAFQISKENVDDRQMSVGIPGYNNIHVPNQKDHSDNSLSSESDTLEYNRNYKKESQHRNRRERRNKTSEYRKNFKGRQSDSDHYSQDVDWTSSSETDSDSDEEDTTQWQSYFRHCQRAYQLQSPYMNMHQYPYMNMQQNPYMNMYYNPYMHHNYHMAAFNPYIFSNPWTGHFNLMSDQWPHMTGQHVSRNMERQQKYMRKMLKNLARIKLGE